MLRKVITICLAQWNSRVQCPFLKLKQRAYRYKIINLPQNPNPFVWFWRRFVNICKDLQEYKGGGGCWRVRCVDILHNRFLPQNILGGLDYIKIPVTYTLLSLSFSSISSMVWVTVCVAARSRDPTYTWMGLFMYVWASLLTPSGHVALSTVR